MHLSLAAKTQRIKMENDSKKARSVKELYQIRSEMIIELRHVIENVDFGLICHDRSRWSRLNNALVT